jgi:hypothetical protein
MMILLYDGAILIVAIEADLSRNLTKTCRTWKSASVTRVRIYGTFSVLRIANGFVSIDRPHT